jgi:hypothetical protein
LSLQFAAKAQKRAAWTRQAEEVREETPEPGQTRGSQAWLADHGMHPIWKNSEEEIQNIPGHVPGGYGIIRVVIVQEAAGPQSFFSTDPQSTVQEILEAFADRAAIEQDFHDIKEV